MLSTRTRKSFGVTVKRSGWLRDQRGQGMLEYILVLVVILGTVFVAARPIIASLQKKFEKSIKGGIFRDDRTGSNFYYFPVK